MTLGNAIKHLRQQRDLSQPQLAQLCGIEQSYLSKLENDRSIPSNDVYRNLLDGLNLDTPSLIQHINSDELHQLKRQIPDIEICLNQQSARQNNQRRTALFWASLFVALGCTLLYTGVTKVLFSESHYRYESPGVVKPSEPADIFYSWDRLPEGREALQQKRREMEQRYMPDFVTTTDYHSKQWLTEVEQGKRLYTLRQTYERRRIENSLLQIAGVLLLVCGLLGFVVEWRLSHNPPSQH